MELHPISLEELYERNVKDFNSTLSEIAARQESGEGSFCEQYDSSHPLICRVSTHLLVSMLVLSASVFLVRST